MKRITCFGSAEGKPGEMLYDQMVRVGKLLADRGAVVVTGGFGGVGMEAPAKGAKENGGRSVGYTINKWQANEFISHVHDCSRINGTQLSIAQQYGLRMGHLLDTDGFIIAAKGGSGTMAELLACINLNRRIFVGEEKPCVILNPPAANILGWDEEMLGYLEKIGVISPECQRHINIAPSAEEAVFWIMNFC